jgi:hypothetical protein
MSDMKILSCLRPIELAGDTELRLLWSFLSLTLPPPETLSSKGLGPRDATLGECGVRRPGLGGGAGMGWGKDVGNPLTGLDGLSK